MTGRKGRVVRRQQQQQQQARGANADGGSLGGGSSVASRPARQQVVYELRAKPDSSEMDSLNGECASE
jgi:hypothetical protein